MARTAKLLMVLALLALAGLAAGGAFAAEAGSDPFAGSPATAVQDHRHRSGHHPDGAHDHATCVAAVGHCAGAFLCTDRLSVPAGPHGADVPLDMHRRHRPGLVLTADPPPPRA